MIVPLTTMDTVQSFVPGFAPERKSKSLVGLHGEGETPVPIPNTAVKPFIGYYTWV
jgi:hypothetical protein